MKKTNKFRKYIIITICALALLLTSALSACKIEKCTAHDWGEWIVTADKTCSLNGGRYHVCKTCGETVSEELPASHEFGEWIDEIVATCSSNGVKGHYSCSECNKDFDAQYIEINELQILGGHILTSVNGYDKTCTTSGLVSYEHCERCEKNFDTNGNEIAQTTIEAGHSFIHYEKVEKTCLANGMQEYYYCEDCDTYFDKEKQETTKDALKIKKGHELTHYKAKDKTCTSDGNLEYYQCSLCDKKYNFIGIEIYEVIIEGEHEYGELIKKTDKTCTSDGMQAHYHCLECDRYFDENKKQTSKVALTIPASHDTVLVEEKEKTCTSDGNIEHEKCKDCFACIDADGNELTSVIIPASHDAYPVDYKEESCSADGNLEHIHCETCNKNFDADGNELDSVVIPARHKYSETAVEKEEPSCESDGMEEHYTCSGCSALFIIKDDEYQQVSAQDLTIVGGHSYYEKIGKQATCISEGELAHFGCENCEKVFMYDEISEQFVQTEIENLVIEKIDHDYIFVQKQESSDTENGKEEHYICSQDGCEKYFVLVNGEYVEVSEDDLIIEPTAPKDPDGEDEQEPTPNPDEE